MSKIHDWVERGSLDKVKVMLQENGSLIHTCRAGHCSDQPLHIAAWQDHSDIALLLIETGAEVNAKGDEGRTPLHYAALFGNVKTAKMLIDSGAELDLKDDSGHTPILLAARGRETANHHIIQLLLEHGAFVDLNTAVCIGSKKHVMAILEDDPTAVKKAPFPDDLLYDTLAYIQHKIWQEISPLSTPEQALPVIIKHRQILDLLLQHGVDVNGISISGRPCLFEAVQLEHPVIAETLMKLGADVNYKTESGEDAWTFSDRSVSKEAMHQLLLNHGYQPLES
ncbi:ankyrin repeat domain-containing protein [candidate division CSSED10-310 bacterium]|uniref:Ankyrin repeat domain-containing protein n=1 Tax=candidate division CSSED10-310 bacterium TaxID=2855610 RepID=A0ABV6YVI5_UNCC1